MNRELAIIQLLKTFHLNVYERNIFKSEELTLSEVIACISLIVENEGKYPAWSIEDQFSGVLIIKNEHKFIMIHKEEISLCKFSIVKTEEYSQCEYAGAYLVKNMFKNGIDGLSIKSSRS